MAKKTPFSSPYRCRHCGNVAPMSYLARANQSKTISPDEPIDYGTGYELLQCPACDKVTLKSYDYTEGCNDWEVPYTFLYPSDPRVPPGLPSGIERAFRAALKARTVDANAFGVLVGRVIEMVCREQCANGHLLTHKVRDLATKGAIPSIIAEITEKLAALRNIGAHAELGDLTEEEIPIIEDLCRALIEYVYTAPWLVKSAAERLTKLKK